MKLHNPRAHRINCTAAAHRRVKAKRKAAQAQAQAQRLKAILRK